MEKAREKGIDVRIALDMVRAAREARGNIFLVFSQDQDLTEAVDEVKRISRAKGLSIRIASAFPHSADTENERGIDKTDWIKIDRQTCDACIDPTDYRTFGVPTPLPPD